LQAYIRYMACDISSYGKCTKLAISLLDTKTWRLNGSGETAAN